MINDLKKKKKSHIEGVRHAKWPNRNLSLKSKVFGPSLVAHTCDPSNWEAGAGGRLV